MGQQPAPFADALYPMPALWEQRLLAEHIPFHTRLAKLGVRDRVAYWTAWLRTATTCSRRTDRFLRRDDHTAANRRRRAAGAGVGPGGER